MHAPLPPEQHRPSPDHGARAWDDAVLAASLFAIDPAGFGGIALRAHAGPVRDAWQDALARMRGREGAIRKLPAHIGDERLIGGLDLAATLNAAKPVMRKGLLAEAHGGIVVVPMAERLDGLVASRLCAALDDHEIALQRDGLAAQLPARIGVVALDEGIDPEETIPPALDDRLSFRCDLTLTAIRDIAPEPYGNDEIAAVAGSLHAARPDDELIAAMVQIAASFGVPSLRAVTFAVRASLALALLEGRKAPDKDDIARAAALVIGPRATMLPTPEPEESQPDTEEPPPPDDDMPDSDDDASDLTLDDVVLDAVTAAIPADLLARLRVDAARSARMNAEGRNGARQKAQLRGRPIGTRTGKPDGRNRLHVVETLRAAAPWQRLRKGAKEHGNRVAVRAEDFRLRRYQHNTESLTIFAVDASGSAALNRLAEAKGAVELLLADCYARRDQVALIAFRGDSADLVLPPTRSLVRAKRTLAGLPGGGGTPLAAAIDAAGVLAEDASRRGRSPRLVYLTDGSANVGYEPGAGRKAAHADALTAAARLRAANMPALMIDTSPRGNPRAEEIATEMGAVYLPLPHADAASVRDAVSAASPQGARR